MTARYGAQSADSSGGVQELIPDLIVPEVIATAAREEVFMPLARRFDLTGPGANFDVPQAGALAFGALTIPTTAGPVETAFNTNKRQFTPAQRFVDVIIPLKVWGDSQFNLGAEVAKEAGIAYAGDKDTLFAALYVEPPTTPDHVIGPGTGVGMSFSDIRDSFGLLYVQNAPKRFAFVVYPTQFVSLLKDDVFINAGVKGSPVLTQGMGANGYVTSVMDVDVYVSDKVADASSAYNAMMFSKNAAIGWGYKMLRSPETTTSQELMVEVHWNSAYRVYEINMTYEAEAQGLKGVDGASPIGNNWMVNIVSDTGAS